MAMEETRGQDYFIRSCNVWYPDFEKEIENMEQRYRKRSFQAMLALLSYFRSEITRQQFLSRFVECEAPKKILSADITPYSKIKSLCSAYQNKEVADGEFDEQLLLSFRKRMTEDVFSPAFESWDEIKSLISKLEKKRSLLPPWLDCFGWLGYLKGYVPRQQYVEIVCDEGNYLFRLVAYGTDAVEEDLKEKYSMELSVAVRLRELCMKYKGGSLSTDEFDYQYLQFAKDFCSDILE